MSSEFDISSESVGYFGRCLPRYIMPCGLYGAMIAIWHNNHFYQKRFPLHRGKLKDYWRYVAWCATQGYRKFPLLLEIPSWRNDLSSCVILPKLRNDIWDGGFSMHMILCSISRHEGSFSKIIRSQKTREEIALSYWRGGRHKLNAPPLKRWQCAWLINRYQNIYGLLKVLRHPKKDRGKSTSDLIQEFQLEDVQSGMGGECSGNSSAADSVHFPADLCSLEIRLPSFMQRPLTFAWAWTRPKPTELQQAMVTRMIDRRKQREAICYPFGVNLFGYARGELGIGEDVRTVAEALKENDIPFCIVDIKLGNHISQKDHSVDKWISSHPIYGINIFCQTGIEMTRFIASNGMSAIRGRYTIGLWPWELPEWPESCRHSYALVDEIWGISKYTADSYREFNGNVISLGLPVGVSKIPQRNRRQFKLPAKPYLFFYSFDIHSTLSRKNPIAVIRAFKRAFQGKTHNDVGLVIKVNHGTTFSAKWKIIRLLTRFDPRIHVIESNMRRSEVLALIEACDCVVSLHRSEGFGRGIAEALILGKQVIATDWSGNIDFCKEPRVALVNSHMKPLRNREYFHGDGQIWAEVDINQAAQIMKDIIRNPRKADDSILDLMPQRVGELYKRQIEIIWGKALKAMAPKTP